MGLVRQVPKSALLPRNECQKFQKSNCPYISFLFVKKHLGRKCRFHLRWNVWKPHAEELRWGGAEGKEWEGMGEWMKTNWHGKCFPHQTNAKYFSFGDKVGFLTPSFLRFYDVNASCVVLHVGMAGGLISWIWWRTKAVNIKTTAQKVHARSGSFMPCLALL